MLAEKVTLIDLKKQARAAAAARREAAHRSRAESAALDLARADLPRLEPGVVSGFHPYRSEINVVPLMARLASEGWTTALPVVVAKGKPLVFRRWFPGDPLIAGTWDLRVPPVDAAVVEPDLLLVPLLAFDRRGYRLGYGGGFYDRTLEQLRAKKKVWAIGVAYADQETAQVPAGPDDARLDAILTEHGLTAFAAE
jgi:5-formyltetrahydrofolate cyclo-ligase